MRGKVPYLVWFLLAALCFSFAAAIQPRALSWNSRANSGNILTLVLGDSRRMFANQFFVQADVSYHSGYYPSIFDQTKAPKDSRHMTAREGEPAAEEHEKQMDFLSTPKDWIERFGRHFIISEHTHLQHGQEREILPWLKISAELDPHKIDTYTVAGYWLRTLGKTNEAEVFLRQGQRNNPDSYEILFELGRLYNESYHDPSRARNVWDEALRKWSADAAAGKNPDMTQLDQISVSLAHLEEREHNYARAIQLLELAVKASPHPDALRKQISELQAKLANSQPPAAPLAR
jgi:tetratricopeptide (TPR) repeat protein